MSEKKHKITLWTVLLNLDAIITAVTLTLATIIVNLNVLMRYFLSKPLFWGEEVATGLFVWTVFIGSAYAYRKHAHLGVDILVNALPSKIRSVVKVVMDILELLVLLMLTVISAQYVYHLIFSRSGAFKPALTDMLRIPKWWTGIAVPIGFGLSVIYSIYFMVKGIRAYMKKKGGTQA